MTFKAISLLSGHFWGVSIRKFMVLQRERSDESQSSIIVGCYVVDTVQHSEHITWPVTSNHKQTTAKNKK